jgi:triacylglycerol lipase
VSLTVSALRLVRRLTDAVGVDIGSDFAPLMASARPPIFLRYGINVQRSEFDGIPVVTLQSRLSASPRLVIVAIPGGGYVVRPTVMHWALYSLMVWRTGATVVVPVYPLATEGGTAGSVVPKVANLIADQDASHRDGRVGVYGDSAGGGLALAAVQHLVADNKPVPASLVLVSPLLDVTMSNPAIAAVDDPVLDAVKLRESGLMWAGSLDPSNPLPYMARSPGSRRPMSTRDRWMCFTRMCLSCRNMPGKQTPRSLSIRARAAFTTGRCCQ